MPWICPKPQGIFLFLFRSLHFSKKICSSYIRNNCKGNFCPCVPELPFFSQIPFRNAVLWRLISGNWWNLFRCGSGRSRKQKFGLVCNFAICQWQPRDFDLLVLNQFALLPTGSGWWSLVRKLASGLRTEMDLSIPLKPSKLSKLARYQISRIKWLFSICMFQFSYEKIFFSSERVLIWKTNNQT